MPQIIVTQQLANRDAFYRKSGTVIDASDVNAVIKALQTVEKTPLIIYDLTCLAKHAPGIIFPVSDHINRTGDNPIIGRQKELKVDFTDLTGLYQKMPGGIVTDCLGARFPGTSFEYPSAWLCNISIIARAMDFREISAYLVNTEGG